MVIVVFELVKHKYEEGNNYVSLINGELDLLTDSGMERRPRTAPGTADGNVNFTIR